jgi:hypothetical protein
MQQATNNSDYPMAIGPEDLEPVKKIALLVRRRVSVIKDLIEAGKVQAYRFGGSDDAPRLKVSLRAVQVALLNDAVYRPKRATPGADERPATIHPAALKMLAPRRPSRARTAG